MYKKSIPDNYGMLFVWPYEKKQCVWMKNTLVPLSIGYLNKTGKIIGIYDMVPLSKNSVCSNKVAKYALEVNLGWFEENKIEIGDVIKVKTILSNDK